MEPATFRLVAQCFIQLHYRLTANQNQKGRDICCSFATGL
jgi:hypothetical protein